MECRVRADPHRALVPQRALGSYGATVRADSDRASVPQRNLGSPVDCRVRADSRRASVPQGWRYSPCRRADPRECAGAQKLSKVAEFERILTGRQCRTGLWDRARRQLARILAVRRCHNRIWEVQWISEFERILTVRRCRKAEGTATASRRAHANVRSPKNFQKLPSSSGFSPGVSAATNCFVPPTPYFYVRSAYHFLPDLSY